MTILELKQEIIDVLTREYPEYVDIGYINFVCNNNNIIEAIEELIYEGRVERTDNQIKLM